MQRAGRARSQPVRLCIAASVLAAAIAVRTLHPVLRHISLAAPVYSYTSVAELLRLGLPLYPRCTNRPYVGSWAGHHVFAEQRTGMFRTFRFETHADRDTVIRWYAQHLPYGWTAPGGGPSEGFAEPWEASHIAANGQPEITIRVQELDLRTCIFYYLW